MVDYARAREHMVDSQVRTSSVSDWRILAQMGAVPREDFVAPGRRAVAYVDDIQWFASSSGRRFMSPPALIGKLLQLAGITAQDTVLVVGAGTGYSTALIAGLARAVTGLESDPALAATARAALSGVANASIVQDDFAKAPAGPFDVILVEGAMDSVPSSYREALSEHGRIVVPLLRAGVPVAHVVERQRGEWLSRPDFKAALPPLMPVREGETFIF